MKKVQIVALIEPELRANIDALRIISEESRARVLEALLAAAVERELLDPETARGLDRVRELADRAGLTFEAYTAAYAAEYAQAGRTAPGLDALEDGQGEVAIQASMKAARKSSSKA